MFLSDEELIQLTGYVRPSKQVQWLCRNAVPHYVNAAGRPVVPVGMTQKRIESAPKLGRVE